MRRIHVLPPEIVRRIAAGETIDRPASVIKELIENSIDAGATSIRIDVRSDGLDTIRVSDDGCGIPSADVELAFARHTTSKVVDEADLDVLTTLGFRGEALASIAAVSEMTLETRTEGEDIGVSLTCAAGAFSRRMPVARRPGTTVTVRDLFRDMPARLSLIRSNRTGRRELWLLVCAYVFATPGVSFHLRIDGRDVLRGGGAARSQDAVPALYGSGMENLVVPLAHADRSRFDGFVSLSTMSRPDRDHIFLSLNGRPVSNRALRDGLEAGYRPFFPRGRHPIAAVRVMLPPSHIDSNVHPAKREVRVMGEAALRADLSRAVRATLEAAVAPPGRRPDLAPSLLLRGGAERDASSRPPEYNERGSLALALVASTSGGLLVAESAEGLYLVDQHRAHERLIYNRFRHRHRPQAIAREELVEPIVLELPAAQARRLSSRLGELEEAGIVCEQFGGRSFIVRAAPRALSRESIAGSLEETLGDDQEIWLDRLLASLACRSAVRKGATLPAAEQAALIDGLAGTYAPAVCPHGSPVLLHLSDDFLRRQFGW